MRKFVFLAIFLAAFLLTPHMAQAAFNNESVAAVGLKATVLNQDPDPARPGDVVTVRLQLENQGRTGLRDVYVRLTPKYPLTAYGSTEVYVPYMAPKQQMQYAQTVKFKMLVGNGATDGDAEFDVFFGNNNTGFKQTLSLEVDALEGNVIVTQFVASPSNIVPGKESEVTFEIANNANSSANDISLSLDFSSSTIPIVPVQISSTQQVESLLPGQKMSITYRVLAFADAVPGTYKVPVTLNFTNENGNTQTIKDYFGFTVGDVPDIQLTIDSTEIYKSGESGLVTVRFSNKGVSDVKFLNIELMENENVVALSSPKVYVGQLDSDDFETATFRLNVRSNEKELLMPMKLTYMDSTNQQYEKAVSVPLRLYSSTEVSKYNLRKQSSGFMWLVVLAAIAAGAWYWKKKRQ